MADDTYQGNFEPELDEGQGPGEDDDAQHYDAPAEDMWFHGPVGREEGEKLLLQKGAEGSYLVRESLRNPGDFSLSFRTKSGVKHFKIICEWGDYYMGGRKFTSLANLVGFYIQSALSENMTLKTPLKPEGRQLRPQSGVSNMVVALYDYVKATPDELNFRKGDYLAVLNNDDPSWWWARLESGSNPGAVGFIPSTLVQATAGAGASPAAAAKPRVPPRHLWLHGAIPRGKAESLLMSKAKTASYLVRESENSRGNYSISFRVSGTVKHFRIEAKGSSSFVCGGRTFGTLEEVIARYLSEPLTDNTRLGEPFPP